MDCEATGGHEQCASGEVWAGAVGGSGGCGGCPLVERKFRSKCSHPKRGRKKWCKDCPKRK